MLACLVTAEQRELRIVTEAWPPYVYLEQGQPRGLDYEISFAVLQRLGIPARLEFMPWKRVLSTLQAGQADAILAIGRTPEREAYLLYPDEYLSRIDMVLFYALAHPHRFRHLEDLRGLKIGVSPGYHYANRAFREADYFIREPAPSHEANLGKLLRGRIDLMINDRLVGMSLAKSQGVARLIGYHPTPVNSDFLYLALRRSEEFRPLAEAFAAELILFKRSANYRQLLHRYESD